MKTELFPVISGGAWPRAIARARAAANPVRDGLRLAMARRGLLWVLWARMGVRS